MITYRPDVDGLRAIAILSVVIYHAQEQLLPGGFIGVDVFFVISGYLITKLIAGEIAQDRFSIARFYVRRTKRIFPALFVVLFTTLALGFYLLTPTELGGLGRTLAATAAFVSNMVFWQDTGYFDVAAETKPLLHTWSLAVEEQFYVGWPLMLLFAHKLRLKLRPLVFGIIALSFAASCYAVVRHPPSAFFLLPSRAWELLAGAVLALGLVRVPQSAAARNAGGFAGLAMILVGLVTIDRTSAFPGWNAMLPVLGTALLIASGEQGSHIVSRQLLTRRPMILVGLISYSLYLWHWPLLTLARVTQRGTLTLSQALAVIAVAIGLSALTWRFVEQPLRAKSRTPAATPVLLRYALVSIAAFAVGAFTYTQRGFVTLASPEIARTELARYDVNPLSGGCLRWQADRSPIPGERCMTGQDRFARRLAIWGDSHADSVAPGIVRYATSRGYATHQLTMAACPPLADVEVDGPGVNYAPCIDFNRQVMEYITREPAVQAVVLTARWPLYTENARFGDDPGPITYLVDRGSEGLSPEASKRAFSRALGSTIDAIRRAGKAVIVLGTVPPLGTNIPDCLARNHMPLSGVRDCSMSADAVLPHMRFADSEIVKAAAGRPGVCSYLPKQAFCSSGTCVDSADGEILYANDDHLSARGAEFLSRFFDFDSCLSTPVNAPTPGLTTSTIGQASPAASSTRPPTF